MPDENKRPSTRKPSRGKPSHSSRRDNARGLSLSVAYSVLLVIMLIATVWSAAQQSLSWPFLLLFGFGSLTVVALTRFEGLFLITCSVPIFFGVFSVATGWLISELQTTSDSPSATSVVTSFYPFIQHFPALLITVLGTIIITVFRWTSLSHKVTANAQRIQRVRRTPHTSNAHRSPQPSTLRRLDQRVDRLDINSQPSETLKDHVMDVSRSQQRSHRDYEYSPYHSPADDSHTERRSDSDHRHHDALELDDQNSLLGSTQVPLIVSNREERQDYAGGIVSPILPPLPETAPGSHIHDASSVYTLPSYSPETYNPESITPRPVDHKFFGRSSHNDGAPRDADSDFDPDILAIANGDFEELDSAPEFLMDSYDEDEEDLDDIFDSRDSDPVYPQYRPAFNRNRNQRKRNSDKK